MISIVGIDHVNLNVSDLEESIRFYGKVFGFKIKEKGIQGGEPWAIIGLKNVAYLCMYQLPGGNRPDGGLTINHFGFKVDKFDTLIESMKHLDIPALYDGAIGWAHSQSIYIQDPDGYEIELSEKFGGGLM